MHICYNWNEPDCCCCSNNPQFSSDCEIWSFQCKTQNCYSLVLSQVVINFFSKTKLEVENNIEDISEPVRSKNSLRLFLQICKSTNLQVLKITTLQICNYTNLKVHKSINLLVYKSTSLQINKTTNLLLQVYYKSSILQVKYTTSQVYYKSSILQVKSTTKLQAYNSTSLKILLHQKWCLILSLSNSWTKNRKSDGKSSLCTVGSHVDMTKMTKYKKNLIFIKFNLY